MPCGRAASAARERGTGVTELDVALFRVMNAAGSARWLDAFFLWLTAPPHRNLLLASLVLALSVLGGRRARTALLLGLIAVGLSDLVAAQLVKPWIDRLRPCFALPDVTLLLPRQARSPSFPSNHAANAFAVAVALRAWGRVPFLVGCGIAALVAYSRVYLGVHYPFDALGGALLGSGISLMLLHLRGSARGFHWPLPAPAVRRRGQEARVSRRKSG